MMEGSKEGVQPLQKGQKGLLQLFASCHWVKMYEGGASGTTAEQPETISSSSSSD